MTLGDELDNYRALTLSLNLSLTHFLHLPFLSFQRLRHGPVRRIWRVSVCGERVSEIDAVIDLDVGYTGDHHEQNATPTAHHSPLTTHLSTLLPQVWWVRRGLLLS